MMSTKAVKVFPYKGYTITIRLDPDEDGKEAYGYEIVDSIGECVEWASGFEGLDKCIAVAKRGIDLELV